MSFLGWPLASSAAEWWMDPSIGLSREYNDNIRLVTSDPRTTRGTFITPKLNLGARSDIWQLDSDLMFARRRYSGEGGLDSDDYFMNIGYLYNTERNTFGIDGSFRDDTTLNIEDIDPDTGLTGVQREVKQYSISPSWSWVLTEQTQLQTSAQFGEVSYDEHSERVGLFDYKSHSLSGTISHQLSSATQIFSIIGYSFFRVPTTDFESETINLQAGMSHNFSETLSTSLSVGLRETESVTKAQTPIGVQVGPDIVFTGFTALERTDKDSGIVYTATLDKQFEIARLNITASQNLFPSGSGGQVENTSININLRRPLTERLTATLQADAFESNEVTGIIRGTDRKFYRVSPGLSWEWTEELSLRGSYRYTRMKRDVETATATSNVVNLSLVYQWPRVSISR